MPGNVANAVLEVARVHRQRELLRTGDASFGYAWLMDAAQGVAGRLRAMKPFQPGDRVVLLAENSPEYLAAFYGILLADGVAVPLPPNVPADRLSDILRRCECDVVLATERVLRQRDRMAATVLAVDPDERPSGEPARSTRTAEQLAVILFTSGSTGAPKGVMLSHRNLLANAQSIREYLRIGSADRALVVLPFGHAFGNSILQSHVLSGATLILDGTPTFPESILDAICDHSATSFSGVPEVFETLLRRTNLGERPLPSLKAMTVAGGALEPRQAQEVARRIRPAEFFVMYGQTEATARLSYLHPEDLLERPGSIGRGIPGVTLQVVGEHGRPVRPGEIGEIRARGPNIMLGYWREPEETAKTIRNGWLHTGDLATVDDEGFIYPKGRNGSLVKINGHRVHPSELDGFVASRFPDVRAVAVPFEHAGRGIRLALFIQCEAGLDNGRALARRILQACRGELPRHLVPVRVEAVREFPSTPAMKLDRYSLRLRAEHGASRPSTTDQAMPAGAVS